jgi:hypothetical protein
MYEVHKQCNWDWQTANTELIGRLQDFNQIKEILECMSNAFSKY